MTLANPTRPHPATTDVRGPTRHPLLVDAAWLQEHLHDPGLRLVEVDVSRASYDAGHLEGAVLWNVYTDLKDGDYQPVDDATFEALVRRSGISADSTVVLYGYAPALALWLLQLHGHADARILDCSVAAWVAGGRPLTTDVASVPATGYRLAAPQRHLRAEPGAVRAAIESPGCTLLDVRSAAEYCGERFWPSGGSEPGGRAGHVPSALHVPLDDVLDESGAFRPDSVLREVFADVDIAGDGELVTYCTIGGRAATAWFALTRLLGREHVRVYDGSWAQWGRTPGAPVQAP